MNFHPKIVLIYALLSLQRRETNLRVFLIQKLEFCPFFCDLVHVQSVSELLSKVNHVATRLCHLKYKTNNLSL